MATINVDLSKVIGKIRPVHGVNGGPRTTNFTYNATDFFKEASIPYCRLHDVEYPNGSGEYIDIHCVFKNFDADVNDPASYNFFLSDHYIGACLEAGSDIIFRLGESAANAPLKTYVKPPKDFKKWAEICEHIIRHYNEGWANGYHWNIKYWEIWNEPDLGTDATWGGTIEEYFDLYEITARHLKSCFPHLKIGGPSNAGNTDKGLRFIEEMGKRKAPLDFFSFHKYTHKVEVFEEMYAIVKECLIENGYPNAEIHLNEWNYVECWKYAAASFRKLVGIRGAAFCAATLIAFQHMGLSVGNYFEADVVKEWCGLFEVDDMILHRYNEDVPVGGMGNIRCKNTLKARKPYYAFKTFGALYRLAQEVESNSDCKQVRVCAATDNEKSTVMISTYQHDIFEGKIIQQAVCPASELRLNGLPTNGSKISVYLTDEGHEDKCMKEYLCEEESFVVPMRLYDEQIYRIEVEPA